jgi:hypothetical protein
MICAGFGGQGVLTIGKFLAKAGMTEGKKFPGYLHTARDAWWYRECLHRNLR